MRYWLYKCSDDSLIIWRDSLQIDFVDFHTLVKKGTKYTKKSFARQARIKDLIGLLFSSEKYDEVLAYAAMEAL